jgi:hypothetical protein
VPCIPPGPGLTDGAVTGDVGVCRLSAQRKGNGWFVGWPVVPVAASRMPQVVGSLQELFFSAPRPQGLADGTPALVTQGVTASRTVSISAA